MRFDSIKWFSRAGSALSEKSDLPRSESYSWPTTRQIGLALLLALLVTAIDIHFSKQAGALAYPPHYEAAGYMRDAKYLYYWSRPWVIHPRALTLKLIEIRFSLDGLDGTPLWRFMYDPVWQALMLLNFYLFGEGEWQAYAVRFWPTLLLVLLVAWTVRRHAGNRMAIVAAIFTALLPTLSPGLHSSLWEYLTGRAFFKLDWQLADLLPDVLYTVFLLWAVVLLIERVHKLDRRTSLAAGAFAGLAILTKLSTWPVTCYTCGLTVLYVLFINRKRLFATLRTCLWGLLSFSVLIGAAAMIGWFRYVAFSIHYLTLNGSIYALPNRTLLGELSYYWKVFPFHLGYAGVIMLGIGLVSFVISLKRGKADARLFAYLGLAAAVYGLVTATPPKAYFIGLPYYLLLWLFSWRALSHVLKEWINQRAWWVIALVPSVYVVLLLAGGFYALRNFPQEEIAGGRENRAELQLMAKDLRGVLKVNDCFTYLPLFGSPAALQYYMTDKDMPEPPTHTSIDPCGFSPAGCAAFTTAQYVQTATRCKAVMVYADDRSYEVNEIARIGAIFPTRVPYLVAIKEWVVQPGSGYRLAKVYKFSDQTAPFDSAYRFGDGDRRGFSIQLYLKNSVGSLTSTDEPAPGAQRK